MKPSSLQSSSSHFNLKTLHVNTIKMGWRRGPRDPLYFSPFLMWSSNKSVCHHYSPLQLAYWEQVAEPRSGRGCYWTQSTTVKTNKQTNKQNLQLHHDHLTVYNIILILIFCVYMCMCLHVCVCCCARGQRTVMDCLLHECLWPPLRQGLILASTHQFA